MTSPDPFWHQIVSDWSLVGPPLRPAAEDTAVMERMVCDWHRNSGRCDFQAGVLGVTPEIVGMKWPQFANITAFDKEPAMISNLWPREGIPGTTAICCNWLSLPVADGTLDVIVGDGSLTQLAFPDEYRKVIRELARVMVSGGILVLRLFVAPHERESVDTVFEKLWGGHVENFNAFRWRLLMSLQENPDTGVCIGDAWEAWHSRIPSPELLANALGWPMDVVGVIDRYRSATTVYSFPSLEAVRAVLEPNFYLAERIIPSYQDGDRYPTVCFRKI